MFIFLNGKIIEQREAVISPFDRGFQFSEGVYEVIRYYPEKFFSLHEHIDRLKYSLTELNITHPPLDNIETVLNELILRNNLSEELSIAYIQVTRGTQYPRRHSFSRDLSPTFFISAEKFPANKKNMADGVRVGLEEDIRWARCDIKTTSLLPNVLTSRRADEKNFTEFIYHRNGKITEGAHTNVCFVRNNELITPPLSNFILSGITRKIVLGLCGKIGISCYEREIELSEINNFDEVMILGTTTEITPVIEIDGRKVNTGKPGAVCRSLQKEYGKLCQ